jgi:hypothetical protein
MEKFHFTFDNIEKQYRYALDCGYNFITMQEYFINKDRVKAKTIVNRVDIDFSVKKADRLRDIFDRLKIKSSFFLRLHAPEYNPFSFENYRIIKKICNSGHELGYHSEIIDQAAIWNENATDCLIRDVNIINKMFDIKITGVASHGGNTGLNNLDFWKDKKPNQFGLSYEAYENSDGFNLFHNSFYISDSEWTKWKCYKNGELCKDDRRSFREHLEDNHDLIYLLIHPDTYFDKHFYE